MSIQGARGKVSQANSRKLKDMSQYERLPFGYQAGHPTKARWRSKSYGMQDEIVPIRNPVITHIGDANS
jgi:hypothetical protein